MARLTVEDCLDHVDNRFNLVLLASRRARQLGLGASPLVTADKDKPTVLALREIAEGRITKEMLDAEEARLPKPQKVPEYQYTPDDFND